MILYEPAVVKVLLDVDPVVVVPSSHNHEYELTPLSSVLVVPSMETVNLLEVVVNAAMGASLIKADFVTEVLATLLLSTTVSVTV